jgi:hypothetical protein
MIAGDKDPKKSRDKKSQSDRPRRRPRRAAQPISAGNLFRKVATEKVPIEVGTGTMMMTHWEALIRQIHGMAYEDASAARLLNQIRKRFSGSGKSKPKTITVVSDNDMKY